MAIDPSNERDRLRRRDLEARSYDVVAFRRHIDAASDEFERDYLRSLQTGFIDQSAHPSAPYAPRLLYNDSAASENVLSTLEQEFQRCERFDVAVAFVTDSGVTVLMKTLLDLERRGVQGRVLVSTYLGFNDPDALARLARFTNIELKAFEGPLHSKGYLFDGRGLRTLVIGSSNLTQEALLANSEWNLLVRSYEQGAICEATRRAFDQLWESPNAKPVTGEWLALYRAHWRRPAFRNSALPHEAAESVQNDAVAERPRVVPNKMQREALANLAKLRASGKTRALLISATGTGKTYLAAFDVAAVNPRRMLFVVHRERIAKEALDSFAKVVDSRRRLGLYAGSSHEIDADYLFCTVQSLARHLDVFDPKAFDYVVFDEAHHVGAGSYQRIATHFEPHFMLGMTATPSRNDDFNVYDFFDNNIAYQITLQRAQAADMLAPFHYFGIHDLEVDGQEIDDYADFARLTSEARVEHVIAQIERYDVDTERRGLVFCSRTEEAHRLARLFCDRGYRSIALDGSSSDQQREDAIERLECDRSTRDDWLELIFTVDIFNEGVDIPSVNLVVMLRPTESAIIFVQQLGRGLRLHEGKDYVLVLDFIGNYKKSYLIPIALSGDRTYNKDNLRRFVREGNRIIPGCSTISFDEVSERRIYQLIDREKFGSIRLVRNEYAALKNMLGRIPTLMDFYENGSIDVQLIFSNSSLGSYHAFLSKYEPGYHTVFTKTQEQMLRFVSQKLASGKRVQELLLLKMLLASPEVTREAYERAVCESSDSLPIAACSVRNVLSVGFLTGGQANTFSACSFLASGDGDFKVSDAFARALRDLEFRRQFAEAVDYGIFVHEKRFAHNYGDTSLVLYQKYTYEDVCRLLEWRQNVNGQNIGGYKYDAETNTFPVFINYEKGDDIADSIRYQDRFVTPARLIAISKQPRNLHSPEIERLRNVNQNGMRTHLFVRKNKNDAESKEFYYLGEMRPTGRFVPIVMAGTDKPAVEIEYDLLTPVADELYDYLTSG
ncbi:MAG: DEAD/DEAH box helicase [Atopobiaceae bacterium]|nr:DEAD/DEAH box helicase [Atopobiaceae bacterium]